MLYYIDRYKSSSETGGSMKKRLLVCGIVSGLVITGVLMHLYGEALKGQARQRAIAEQIIRLHVIANSDGEEDQEVKIKVKGIRGYDVSGGRIRGAAG